MHRSESFLEQKTIKSIKYRYDIPNITTLWLQVNILPVGVHNFTIAMKDIAGNIGTCSFMITITPNYSHLPTPRTTGFSIFMVITIISFLIAERGLVKQRTRKRRK